MPRRFSVEGSRLCNSSNLRGNQRVVGSVVDYTVLGVAAFLMGDGR